MNYSWQISNSICKFNDNYTNYKKKRKKEGGGGGSNTKKAIIWMKGRIPYKT